jgi:hypothetical protein
MDRPFSLHRLIPSLALPAAHCCQLLDPCLVAIEFCFSGGRDRLAQKFGAIRDDSQIDAAAAADLFGFNINLDNTGIRRNNAVAAASCKPNPRAEQDNKIRAFATTACMGSRMNGAECAEAQWMLLGNSAARFRVGKHGHMRDFSEFSKFFRCLAEPYSAARQNSRALGFIDPLECLLESLTTRSGGRLRAVVLRERHALFLGPREENIYW